MAAIVEMIVHRLAEAAPIEDTVSNFVAGVLESTANKLSRFEPRYSEPEAQSDEVIA